MTQWCYRSTDPAVCNSTQHHIPFQQKQNTTINFRISNKNQSSGGWPVVSESELFRLWDSGRVTASACPAPTLGNSRTMNSLSSHLHPTPKTPVLSLHNPALARPISFMAPHCLPPLSHYYTMVLPHGTIITMPILICYRRMKFPTEFQLGCALISLSYSGSDMHAAEAKLPCWQISVGASLFIPFSENSILLVKFEVFWGPEPTSLDLLWWGCLPQP